MEKQTGTVEAVSNKDDKYGFRMNNVWYNGFGDSPVNRGEEVEVEYEVNGNFKNVRKVNILKEKPSRQSGIEETARLRRKTDCLRMAVDLHINDKETKILPTAEKLSNWVEGTTFIGIPVEKELSE